jgi:D-alanyl-lipoteichoic acid acyltransferase DltB (MBOAT superfamily)
VAFNSLTYLFLFFPVVASGYFVLARRKNQSLAKYWLILASLVFYAQGRATDLFVLGGSLAGNYLLGRRLLGAAPQSRRLTLIGAISANVILLCAFKYAGFFATTFNQATGSHLHAPAMSLPLGISFFTVQMIMFLVDCFEGGIESAPWLDFLLFGSFFTYITMGPLVRWKQIVPQWNDPSRRRPNADRMAPGLFLFASGLFKKVVLADCFFRWADAGYSYTHPLSFAGAWITALAFTFELYFDFSGYTDMALGAALMLNFDLPQNFDAPFRSRSIIEFWRRWHITLTNFITTYIYTPMLQAIGSVTFAKAMVVTFLAMVIAGFWHGASWTFIVFGMLHGIAIIINQVWRKNKLPMPDWLGVTLTFLFVVGALVFFRSRDLAQAWGVSTAMLGLTGKWMDYTPWSGIDRFDQLVGVSWLVFGLAVAAFGPGSAKVIKTFKPSWVTVSVLLALAVVACIYANGVVSRSFVYRDF